MIERRLAITGGGLRLRDVRPEDAPDLYRWRMDSSSREFFRSSEVVSYRTHEEFLARYFAGADGDRWFVIEADGQAVGAIALYAFSSDRREAEWGRFVVAPEWRRRGVGRGALRLLLERARELGMRRLRCEVLAGNVAENLYRSLGFVDVGSVEVGGRRFLQMESTLDPAALEAPARDPVHLFVPLFRTDEVLAEIRECLERGWTGMGFKTVAFENAWRAYSGLPFGHFLGSATFGLHLAFRLLREREGWQAGDEVITTPLTFVATNHAVLHAGLKPVFADVDEYLCLSPESVRERITSRTRAVCFVGLGGNPGRYREVLDCCRERGLRMVLDAAHMAGTWSAGRHAGWDADATVFSFQAVKNLPTADAGMVCFADEQLDREVRKWSWLGINKDTFVRTLEAGTYQWRYDVEHEGFKYHGNSIMAAIGLVGLKYLEHDNDYRRRLAGWYDEELAGLAAVTRVPMAPDCTPSRHLYQIQVDDRDQVMLRLNAQAIYPGIHYQDNIRYRMYAGAEGACPRARRASERLISLPLHLKMDRPAVHRVAAALRAAVAPGPA